MKLASIFSKRVQAIFDSCSNIATNERENMKLASIFSKRVQAIFDSLFKYMINGHSLLLQIYKICVTPAL